MVALMPTEIPTEKIQLNAGLIISSIIPVVALILSIIGIVLGALYHKNSKTTHIHTNKGKATAGIVFSVIGTILAFIASFSCIGCALCSASAVPEITNPDNYNYYFDEYADEFDKHVDEFC